MCVQLSNSVSFSIQNFEADMQTLGAIIDQQKRQSAYMGHSMALAHGLISTEEMDAIDDQFAYEPRQIDQDQLIRTMNLLLKFTKADFTIGELASLLQTEEPAIESALAQMARQQQSSEDTAP